jgi:hypothetical protein
MDYYNDIKKSLQLIAKSQESFDLYPSPPPQTDDLFLNDPKVPEMLKKYNIIPTEIHKVISNFHKNPQDLTEENKNLRIKYLKVLLDLIKENESNIDSVVRTRRVNNFMALSEIQAKNLKQTKELFVRLINFLIKESDPVVCPTCPLQEPCPISEPCKVCEMCPTLKKDNFYFMTTVVFFILFLAAVAFLFLRK